MQLATRFHEPICYLALDCFAPVRKQLVHSADHLQETSRNLLRTPALSDQAMLADLSRFSLAFAPTNLGHFLNSWYAIALPPEISRLLNAVFPVDSEGRLQHATFREIFGNGPALDAALCHYDPVETALFAAFATVETTLTSTDVPDSDLPIIADNLRFDLNRDQTYPFQAALLRFLRARIICDYFAATRVQVSQVDRFAAATGLPITHAHLEGLWARVH